MCIRDSAYGASSAGQAALCGLYAPDRSLKLPEAESLALDVQPQPLDRITRQGGSVRNADYVRAGLDGCLGALSSAVKLCNGLHLHAVADYNSVEAEFTSQYAGEYAPGHRGGYFLGFQRREKLSLIHI